MPRTMAFCIAVSVCLLLSISAASGAVIFSTNGPDGRIALASNPATAGLSEIETADDFILTLPTTITGASFTGLIVSNTGNPLSNLSAVGVELYHVFPADSTNPPDTKVPTRVNSPSDNAFVSRDSTSGLTFTTTILNSSFAAANSILNGINPFPNQTTGGEGAVTGIEVRFDITFTTPITLAPDHYFFKPEVGLSSVAAGQFYWLSAPKPIVSPGTPFTPDLQAWIRNTNLDPDWLRAGTDIVGGGANAPTFNATFSLLGVVVPEPSTFVLIFGGSAFWHGDAVSCAQPASDRCRWCRPRVVPNPIRDGRQPLFGLTIHV